MSSSRKRTVVSLETKLKAIKRLDKGETIKRVDADLGVGEVTVGDWKRKRADIEKWCSQKDNENDSKRKTMKTGEFEKTSSALFMWFTQLRSKGSPVSGPLLQEKAIEFHNKFKDGEEEFTASRGWLHRWKTRYGIRELNISGEKLSSDHEIVVSFKDRFKTLIDQENLSLQQIFNCDETGLNYRMLPTKTLASKQEASAPGFKKSKDRVTLLACSNATGDCKLKLLLIGKSAKPRAFKNISISSLPVLYKNQKSAWMDSKIFKEWFFDSFVPQVEKYLAENNLPRKALMLMDNCPAHPDTEEMVSGEIKTMFLPPNVTPLLQPMDQGVLENLKRNYKRRRLKLLIKEIDEGNEVLHTLKAITMKDVVYMTAESWEEVKSSTLERSWRKLYSVDVQEAATSENENADDSIVSLVQRIPSDKAITTDDVEEWINADEQYEVTDDMIVETVNDEAQNAEEVSDEDEPMEQTENKISHAEGFKAIQSAIDYLEQQAETTSTDLLLLRRLRETAAKKRASSVKQKTLMNFFKK